MSEVVGSIRTSRSHAHKLYGHLHVMRIGQTGCVEDGQARLRRGRIQMMTSQVHGAHMLIYTLLLIIRLFWGWQFFLTGKGKLMDLSKPTQYFDRHAAPNRSHLGH